MFYPTRNYFKQQRDWDPIILLISISSLRFWKVTNFQLNPSAMATAATEGSPLAYVRTVEEITRIYKSLPPRPSIEVVEAAVSVLHSVETEEKLQIEEISKEPPPQDVPPELFSVLKEVKKAMVAFKSHEQRKEAAQLVELDRIFQAFDGLIQKASSLVSGDHVLGGVTDRGGFDGEGEIKLAISEEESAGYTDGDDSLSDDDLKNFYPIITSKPIASSSGLQLIPAFTECFI